MSDDFFKTNQNQYSQNSQHYIMKTEWTWNQWESEVLLNIVLKINQHETQMNLQCHVNVP